MELPSAVVMMNRLAEVEAHETPTETVMARQLRTVIGTRLGNDHGCAEGVGEITSSEDVATASPSRKVLG